MGRRTRRSLAAVLICGLLGSSCFMVDRADAKVSSKGYTISKNAGTYENRVTVGLTAKKGFTVYYTTGKKLSKTKKVTEKKIKRFTFKKTTSLKIYAVKSSKKMTAKKLRAVKTKKMVNYQYKIVKKVSNTDSESNQGVALATVTPTVSPALQTVGTEASQTPLQTPLQTQRPEATPIVTPTHPADVIPDTTENPPLTTPGDSRYEGDDSDAGYVDPVRFEYDAEDTTTSADGVTQVTMSTTATGSKVTADTYEISKKNKLTITKPGTYLIQSEEGNVVDGLIEVDYADETVTGTTHLILDGICMTSSNNTEPTSDTGLITIKSSVTKAVITVKDGSVSTLTDVGETGIDKEDGVSTTYTAGIVCKKTPLTINGSGTLNIYSTNGNGIKCTDEMKIIDTAICVSGPDGKAVGHNGITAKLNMAVKDAVLTVHSDGDGLKTTLDETDVEKDPTLAEYGNMELDGGNYDIISENGDGISAYRTIYLNPAVLHVTTKNTAGSLEDSSYKGVKAGTTIFVPETAGTIQIDTSKTYSPSRAGRDSNDAVADDALHCDGHIKINGGTFELAAGDDAVHSDTGLVINGGTILITESYEGLESGDISVNGGVIRLTARDDGMNAAGGNNNNSANSGMGKPGDWFNKDENAGSTNYQIIIRGGEITIDAGGDGIDSNGNIFFQGGTVTVNGSTNSGNGALDYGDGPNYVCEISGGTLIAAGAVGMDVAPTSGSSQPTVNIRLSSTQSAGTYVVLKDSEGNTVLQAQPTKSFQSVVMSCEELKLGSSYTVYYGKDPDALTQGDTVTFTNVSMSTGSSSGGGWGGPWGGPRG